MRPPGRTRWGAARRRTAAAVGSLLRAGGVLGRLRAGDHVSHGRFVAERARDRFLRRLVVVVVDLLVVRRLPVNEHADHDAQVVGLVLRDDAALDRINHRPGHGRLSRSEHLDRLLGALDRDLVEQDRVRLGRQVRRDDGEEGRETVLVVRQRVAKCGARGPRFGTDDQVDMGNLVAVADQRLTKKKVGCHVGRSFRREKVSKWGLNSGAGVYHTTPKPMALSCYYPGREYGRTWRQSDRGDRTLA